MKYVSIFDKDEVNIYEINGTDITSPKQEILKGWRYPASELWIVTLVPKIKDLNTEAVLVSKPTTE